MDPGATAAEHAYFSSNPAPPTLAEHTSLASAFIQYHTSSSRRVALITSGGTTVPLERNTVRFIDNFSAGTRGATSAEHFLEAGYAVIFLHRKFSLLPYARHYSHSGGSFLDFLAEAPGNGDGGDGGGGIIVAEDGEWGRPGGPPRMLEVLRRYTQARRDNMLLMLPFVTITDYLFELREVARLMRPLGARALMYLAAAPSDFFVPPERMSEHKIQSTDADPGPVAGPNGKKGIEEKEGKKKEEEAEEDTEEEAFDNFDSPPRVPRSRRLIIDLDPVPKFLKNLVDGWAPQGFFVSFKLETDPGILVRKARQSLERYQHHLVIGNLLATRKWEVVFVAPGRPDRWLRVPPRRRRRQTGTGVEGLVGAAERAARRAPEWERAEQNGGGEEGGGGGGRDGTGREVEEPDEEVTEEVTEESQTLAGSRPVDPIGIADPQEEPAMEIEGLIIPAIQELHDEYIKARAAPLQTGCGSGVRG